MSNPFSEMGRIYEEMFGSRQSSTPNTAKDVLRKAYPKWATAGQIAERTKRPLKNVDEELQRLVSSGAAKRGRSKNGYVVYRLKESA